MNREERVSLRGRRGSWRMRRELHSMIQEVYQQRDELLALIQETVWLATFVIPKKRNHCRDCKCNSEIKYIQKLEKGKKTKKQPKQKQNKNNIELLNLLFRQMIPQSWLYSI